MFELFLPLNYSYLHCQTLQADELHHIELGGLGLQDVQRRYPQAVLGAQEGAVVQQVLQDGYAVVFLK